MLRSRVRGAGRRATLMVDGLRDLLAREPEAHVAVIASSDEVAAACHAALEPALGARLVLDGAFDFTPGIDCTTVSQVKGLEFDYVVIPDASAARYPETPRARRQLYVAVTRTVRQLWILHGESPSPLI